MRLNESSAGVCCFMTTRWQGSHLYRGENRRFSGRQVAVLLAILVISFSIATRHPFQGTLLCHARVQADPSHEMRRQLAADAFVLTNPLSNLCAMLPRVTAPHVLPADPQLCAVEFTESLYNRPPPLISVL